MKAFNKDNGQTRQRQKDPIGGGYLVPGNCTLIEPPEFNAENETCSFDGKKWVVKEIPSAPEPEPYVETYLDKRKKEYGRPEDQIEFITENGLDSWQKKVIEIKKKYPKK